MDFRFHNAGKSGSNVNKAGEIILVVAEIKV
jgi:hypothetical protein